jgi:cell division protein FtsZ
MAISSPLLEDVSIDGATGILINITGGPDLTLHEVNEASSLIQQAAHEDANIIFGSVIDPNLSDEVRITVIATGFDRAVKTEMIVEPGRTVMPAAQPQRARAQITLPYDVSTQITKEYPPPVAPRQPVKLQAHVVEEPDVHIEWATPDTGEVNAAEAALASLDPVPEHEPSSRMAAGSGPATPIDGTPLVQPDRKRAQSRPSMKAVLAGEIDTESELDVPTFIRRHNSTLG